MLSASPAEAERLRESLLSMAIYSAIFLPVNLPLPEDTAAAKDIAERNREIYVQAQSMQQKQLYHEPGGDLSVLWTQYFAEQARTKEQRGEIQKSRAAWEAAQNDLRIIENCFARSRDGLIDISALGLSDSAQSYIQSLYGTGRITFSAEMQDRVRDYLSRKQDNLAIELLNREADIDFAANLLDADWLEIAALQQEYERRLSEYAAAGSAATEADLAGLERQRDELVRRENAYRQKRHRFLAQQRSGRL